MSPKAFRIASRCARSSRWDFTPVLTLKMQFPWGTICCIRSMSAAKSGSAIEKERGILSRTRPPMRSAMDSPADLPRISNIAVSMVSFASPCPTRAFFILRDRDLIRSTGAPITSGRR
ncbi:hypothetical protein D3C72_1618250 [compost metagenome]